MELHILQFIWFVLTALLLAVFLIMGGFDFGEGMLCAFSKNPKVREHLIKNILPYWDANQVWLITAGGALFAAFPVAYSEVLSQMYVPVMLLLCFLVVRVVAIEFYFSEEQRWWRNFCAIMLAISSITSVVLIGVALGAIFGGEVLLRKESFTENFLRLFTPLSMASALLCFFFFGVQGALFASIKSANDNELVVLFNKYAKRMLFGLLFAFVLFAGVLLWKNQGKVNPATLCGFLVACYIPLRIASRLMRKNKAMWAFVCTSVFALITVFALSFLTYPNIIPAVKGYTEGLSILEASSSAKTLEIMLWIALVGVPLAIAYNIYAHLVFSRKK